MAIEPSPLEWVTIKTTLPALPLPLLKDRVELRTDRLVLRQTRASDLDSWHALRIQPEVMRWTGQGAPDPDLEWSKDKLQLRLSPQGDNTFDFAVCLAETGEMIGVAGSHMMVGELGWPVIGYMLRKEFWGKGYATELVHAFLAAWWALPRAEVDIKVEKSTAVERKDGRVRECIVAVTLDSNTSSQRVLSKAGMELVKAWSEADRQQENGHSILYGFVTHKPTT